MQCLFCGKRLSLVKRMGNARFCTSEHEEKFRREQEEAALALLLDAQTDLGQEAAPAESLEPALTAFSEEEAAEPAVSKPSRADFLIDTSGHRAVPSVTAATPSTGGPSSASQQVRATVLRPPQSVSGPVLSAAWLKSYPPTKAMAAGIRCATGTAAAPGRLVPSWTAWRQAASAVLTPIPYEPPSWMREPVPPLWGRLLSCPLTTAPLQSRLRIHASERRAVATPEPFRTAASASTSRSAEVGRYTLAAEQGTLLNARLGLSKPLWRPGSRSLVLPVSLLTAIPRPNPASIAVVHRGFEDLNRASRVSSSLPLFSRDRFIPFFVDLLDGSAAYPSAEAVPLPPPRPSIPSAPVSTSAIVFLSRDREQAVPPVFRHLPSLRPLAEAPCTVLSPGSAVAPEATHATVSPLEARPSQLARLASRVNATSFGYLCEGGLTKLAAAAAASGACPTWKATSGLAFAGPSIGRPSSRLRVESESVPPIASLTGLAELHAVPPTTTAAKLTPLPLEAAAPSTPKASWKLTAGFNAGPLYPVSTRAASSEQEPRLAVIPAASAYELPAARISALAPGFARLTTLYPVAMPRPAHFKRSAAQLELEMVEQKPLRPTTCPKTADLLTGDGRSGGWRHRVRMPGSIRLPQSWRSLSREVRWAAMALPVLIALWMKFAPSGAPAPPPAPVAARPAAESGEAGFLNAGLQSIRENISRRAAVELVEDFRSGLSSWEGDGDWAKTWAYDAAGFIRPGQMAIYESTRDLVNYHVEFVGQIEKRGLSWAVRSADLKNYYAFRLFISKPGPVPGIALARWAVINGKEDKAVQLPLPHNVRNDTIYQIRVDLQGSDVTTYIQGQVADTWTDRRIKVGGVGLFMTRGDQARFRSVVVTHQFDALGRLCAFLVPPGGIQHNGSLKQ